MKTRLIAFSFLACFVLLFSGHEIGWAKVKGSSEIGVVDMRRVFQECKRNAKYREQATKEQNRAITELEKLSKEIEADRLGLRTLKSDSSDYMSAVKALLTKQASLQAQQEFYKQQLELKDQRWTEQLYQDTLNIIEKLSERKSLVLVLEKSAPEFPSPTASDLMMAIRTHKVLYSGNGLDLTDEVIRKLDAEDR